MGMQSPMFHLPGHIREGVPDGRQRKMAPKGTVVVVTQHVQNIKTLQGTKDEHSTEEFNTTKGQEEQRAAVK